MTRTPDPGPEPAASPTPLAHPSARVAKDMTAKDIAAAAETAETAEAKIPMAKIPMAKILKAKSGKANSGKAESGKAERAKAGTAAGAAAQTRTAKAKFGEIVLVCRKCAKRQGLSKREIRALADAAFRAGAAASGGRTSGSKPRIVPTGCLGPCPKRALAVATGASVAAGRILLVDPTAPPVPDFGPNAGLPAGPGDSSVPSRAR